MALTRKLLEGLGLTDKQVETIIEAHTNTVDGLKTDLSKYKSDAEKLSTVQKELDDLKANSNDGWKEKHDKVKKDFEDYKADITAKEERAAKERAARAYFESKNIVGKALDIAMRGSKDEIDSLQMEGTSIKDCSALDALIAGDFSGLVGTTSTRGASTATPPASGSAAKLSMAEIYKRDDHGRYVMSTAERQKALAQNPDLMR